MPNPVYAYILNIFDLLTNLVDNTLNEQYLIFGTE